MRGKTEFHGFLSVKTFRKLTPNPTKLKLKGECGVHNLFIGIQKKKVARKDQLFPLLLFITTVEFTTEIVFDVYNDMRIVEFVVRISYFEKYSASRTSLCSAATFLAKSAVFEAC